MRKLNTICLTTMAIVLSFFIIVPIVTAERGVSRDTILVGSTLDQSGSVVWLGNALIAGHNVWWSHINAQGGINGRKIKYIFEDDGYKPPMTVSAAKKLIGKDKVFCLASTLGTSSTTALFPIAKKERLPIIAPISSGKMMFDPFKRYIFARACPNDIQAALMVDYIVNDLKKKNPKIAIFYQDDDYGQDGFKGLLKALKPYGIKLKAKTSYKRGSVNFNSQALVLKRAKPDFTLLWTAIRETPAIMREAKKVGLKTQFIGCAVAAHVKALQIAQQAAEGYLVTSDQTLVDDNNEGMRTMREFFKKYPQAKGQEMPNMYSIMAYGGAMIVAEGLKQAGKDLTIDGFVNALENLREFKTGGILPPITYTSKTRAGGAAAFFARADVSDPKKPKFIKITDYRKPMKLHK